MFSCKLVDRDIGALGLCNKLFNGCGVPPSEEPIEIVKLLVKFVVLFWIDSNDMVGKFFPNLFGQLFIITSSLSSLESFTPI